MLYLPFQNQEDVFVKQTAILMKNVTLVFALDLGR